MARLPMKRRDMEHRPVTGWGADPFQMLDQLLHDPFQALARRDVWGESFVPTFDVKERDDHYLIEADLPGVREEDLDVSLTGRELRISGSREHEYRDDEEDLHVYERQWGKFNRSFTLPQDVDPDQVEASLDDGVLTVSLPKQSSAKSRKIALGKRLKDTFKRTG